MGKRGCYAVLRGNSNFELVSGKVKVYSSNTASKQKGKGPYRLTLDNKCNAIVRNNRNQCAWALFGCPTPKRKLKAIKRANPRKQFRLIKALMRKKKAKKKGGLVRLPVAKGAKKIKNQLPKILKKKTPPKPKNKLLVKKSVLKNLKKDLKKNGAAALKHLKKSLKGKAPKKQLKKLGKSMKQIKALAMRKLKKKVAKAVKKAKKKAK